jgi:hypothetical protein
MQAEFGKQIPAVKCARTRAGSEAEIRAPEFQGQTSAIGRAAMEVGWITIEGNKLLSSFF